MRKAIKIIRNSAIMIVIVAIVAYFAVPLVRYLLIPITGGTKAPTLTLGQTKQKAQTGKAAFAVERLSNASEVVNNISQVPIEGGWINSSPLSLQQLEKENKVVLIDFWTFSCINCIRATPYSEELWERYKDHGLVVIGVHSPEFNFERNPKYILAAVKRLGITYPVWIDGDMVVWNAFGNHFWPGKYLINPKGDVVYIRYGEGGYADEEQAIRKALKKAGYKLPTYGPPTHYLVPNNKRETEELYAGPGFIRRAYGNKKQPHSGKKTTYTLPSAIKPNRIYLGGTWLGTHDYVQAESPAQIKLGYLANTPYIVLGIAKDPLDVQVMWDGKAVPKPDRGRDIFVKDGKTYMKITSPRLYYPISSTAPYGQHTIEFIVPKGLRFYSFTFGSYNNSPKTATKKAV